MKVKVEESSEIVHQEAGGRRLGGIVLGMADIVGNLFPCTTEPHHKKIYCDKILECISHVLIFRRPEAL